MASLFEIFDSSFAPPETIENVVAPAPSDAKAIIEKPEAYDERIEQAFDKAEKRVASAVYGGDAAG